MTYHKIYNTKAGIESPYFKWDSNKNWPKKQPQQQE